MVRERNDQLLEVPEPLVSEVVDSLEVRGEGLPDLGFGPGLHHRFGLLVPLADPNSDVALRLRDAVVSRPARCLATTGLFSVVRRYDGPGPVT